MYGQSQVARGRDPAIARAGEAAAGLVAVGQGHRQRRVHLQRHALEVRRAAGAHQELLLVPRRLGQPAQYPLVDLTRDVAQPLAAPGADQEENVEHRCPDRAGKADHVVELVRVVVGHRKVELEHQPGAPAGIDAGERLRPGTRQSTKVVVMRRVEGIEADADGANAGVLEQGDPTVVEQGAVGPDHDHQPVARGVPGKLMDVGPEQRLATGEDDHRLLTERRDLVEQAPDLDGAQLGRTTGAPRAGIEIAMGAAQITPLSEVERDQKQGLSRARHRLRPHRRRRSRARRPPSSTA